MSQKELKEEEKIGQQKGEVKSGMDRRKVMDFVTQQLVTDSDFPLMKHHSPILTHIPWVGLKVKHGIQV